ncbi:transcriptional repressor NsdA [Streptomyces sp. 4N509B]|uniref:transcriptional repressor NsdA n=1 Tax=Streptomyces sp. 4N509B TaxID=3457413 RepID=UPI003FD2B6A5
MGGNGTAGIAAKQPNERLTSWFQRSGWSKGELARQVNRRARQLGAHHISTDTSRVRRWLDGEQPREPIPRILSELFSERFGCVVSVEDLGLRTARQSAAVSGIDLPWAGEQTVALINEFSRSDLMLGRRGFLGSSLSMSAGPSLIEPMQRWLVPSPGETGPAGLSEEAEDASVVELPGQARGLARGATRLSVPELEMLERTTVEFRAWDAHAGGGLRRKAVVGQLHEVTDLLQETHPERVRRRLFRITAELSELAGWMSYDIGLQPTAQKYFVLALHAAKEARDRPLGAFVLSQMSRQMIHLGRGEDALELIHLAQYGSRSSAGARTRSMLHAMEARAYATLGQPPRCHRAVRMAQEAFAEIEADEEEPSWIAFFTEAELNAENAHSYRDLAYVAGRSPMYVSRARPLMERAVRLFAEECASDDGTGGSHLRSYALNLIGLATVHLLAREPEAGAERAIEAVPLASRLRSERVSNRLRRTSAAANREFGQVPQVRELAELLTEELPRRLGESPVSEAV